jgi:LmbE family N-acetylglucosaminyl deacetylase
VDACNTFQKDRRSGCSKALDVPAEPGRLLIVSPHPDDETLGAGGLLHDLSARGWETTVIVATDGGASHPGLDRCEELVDIRYAECIAACDELGLSSQPIFAGFPDGRLNRHIADFVDVLAPLARNADIVVGPRRDDGHSDHVAAAQALGLATGVMRRPPTTWNFAVWGWDLLPAHTLRTDLARAFPLTDAALDAKRRALDCYVSQTTDRFGTVIVDQAMIDRFTTPVEVFWR